MKNTKFELEQLIFDCWGVTDDLNSLFEAVMESDITKDQVANILLGLKDLYNIKFEKTFDMYEQLLAE